MTPIAPDDGLDPHTAHSAESIWALVNRENFEAQTKSLSEKQHVAGRRSYSVASRDTCEAYPLPFDLEKTLANDFAFIAANEPTVGYVSAAAVEQDTTASTILIRLAANEGISTKTRNSFDSILELLNKRAEKGARSHKATGQYAHIHSHKWR